MPTLANYPMIGQLDGSNNEQFDCVPASIASALQYLTGKSYAPADVKNAVYGVNYTGATDPSLYVTYARQHGIIMSAIGGSNEQLIQDIQDCLASGCPVLLTMVDPYVPASLGWTHMVACFACTDNSLTVMDPYVDTSVTKSNQEWLAQLRSGQVWKMEKDMILTIQQASQYFTETTPNKVWHCKTTGFDVSGDILAYYRTCTNVGLQGLSQYGLPLEDAQSIQNAPGCLSQRFERSRIVLDATHRLDSVPGITGPCYPAHIDVPVAPPTLPTNWNDWKVALLALKPLLETLK